MTGEIQINTVNFGQYYCAIFLRPGEESWQFLVDRNRCRRQFVSASEARAEARRILFPKSRTATTADPLGFEKWKADREANHTAEMQSVFGEVHRPKSLIRNGRVIAVETRRSRI